MSWCIAGHYCIGSLLVIFWLGTFFLLRYRHLGWGDIPNWTTLYNLLKNFVIMLRVNLDCPVNKKIFLWSRNSANKIGGEIMMVTQQFSWPLNTQLYPARARLILMKNLNIVHITFMSNYMFILCTSRFASKAPIFSFC